MMHADMIQLGDDYQRPRKQRSGWWAVLAVLGAVALLTMVTR